VIVLTDDSHSIKMDSDRISQLSVRLQQESADYKPGDERQRQKLLAISTEIARAIETPSKRLARMCYVEIYLFVTARILIDLDIFRILSDAGSSMTAAQLADETNSDVVLLGRLLKHVCTQDFVREVGPDEYSASGLTDKIA
jgi:demethylsterigmatocystin 6-O-methyltransferase